ncbi:MAG: peptidase and in kexin sedolisin [Actinomycetia bacterium]|nr:peptidase and in kexin sedolisin [Actinomycetes bacterium]
MLGRAAVAARTVSVTCRVAVAAAVALGAGTAVITRAAPAEAAPADQIRDGQSWVLDMLDIWGAWRISQGAGVTVAVIDSGVNPNVSDLAGSVTTGPDLTGLQTLPSDPSWGVHGTWMASIIAGHGHDGGGSGIIGVAPEAKVLSIRVIPDKADPSYRVYDAQSEHDVQQSLATGITDAVHDGAKVISMSIGYSAPSSAVRAALQYAEQHGVVLVASSGNSGQDDQQHADGFAPVSFPAEYPGVLSVAAVNADGAVASFSSENLSVQVAAPGVDIPAEGRDGAYWLVSGTSPACALVAGVAALIKSRYPGLSSVLVDQALTSTAHAGSGNGYNVKTGFGSVDATAALQAAGKLAGQRPGKSPEAASAHFGGGPAAISPAPVAPRSDGQVILFSLLGLVAFGLTIGSGMWLAARRRRLTRITAERIPPMPQSAAPFPAPPQYPPGQYPPRGYPAGQRYPVPQPPPAGGYPPTGSQQPGASQYRYQETYPARPDYPAGDDHPGQPPPASWPDWTPQ